MTPFERLLTMMTKWWVVIIYLGLVVVSFLYFDRALAYYFHGLNFRAELPILNWFTKLGLSGLYIAPLFLVALFFRYVRCNKEWEVRAWFLWLCVLFPNVICVVLKMLLGRARPDLLFNNQLYGFYGLKTHAPFWSFPSGHTTTVMGFVFGLSVIFPRYGYGFILAGAFVALSRILLTHHYLSDVLIAIYLALLEVGLLVWWLKRKDWLIKNKTCSLNT